MLFAHVLSNKTIEIKADKNYIVVAKIELNDFINISQLNSIEIPKNKIK